MKLQIEGGEHGKFYELRLFISKTALEPVDFPEPEPDYKQAYEALAAEITNYRNSSWNEAELAPERMIAYWKGHVDALNHLIEWGNAHNPKGGE